MPLVNTTGIDNCNNSFFISIAFISREAKDNYNQATKCNIDLIIYTYSKDIKLQVTITNANSALIKAIKIYLLELEAFLYRWHIQKNVLKYYKGRFDTKEDQNKFEKAFNSILNALIEQDYKDQLL